MRNLRTFFLSGSIVLTIIILVIAFQNIQAQCNFVTFFFYEADSATSPTFLVFAVSLVGIITGMLYMGLIMSFVSNEEDDDEF
jgi:uncharacterized integral membrane protein